MCLARGRASLAKGGEFCSSLRWRARHEHSAGAWDLAGTETPATPAPACGLWAATEPWRARRCGLGLGGRGTSYCIACAQVHDSYTTLHTRPVHQRGVRRPGGKTYIVLALGGVRVPCHCKTRPLPRRADVLRAEFGIPGSIH
jgi:hypothetical protein